MPISLLTTHVIKLYNFKNGTRNYKYTIDIPAAKAIKTQNYHLVEEDFEIIPGVEIINLPGHTPGLLGLIIHLEKEGTFIFPMDAVYTNEIYGPPAKASGLLFDRTQYFKSIEKVRMLHKKYNATMIPAHDWDLFKALKKAPYYYE